VDLVPERIELRRPLRTPKRRRRIRPQRRRDRVPRQPVPPNYLLARTPRTKCSRRSAARRSTSNTLPPALDQHDRARLTITPDASAHIQGGQNSTGEEGSVSRRHHATYIHTGSP